MSTWMMVLLLVEYGVLTIAFIIDRNWPMGLYFFGVTLLQIGMMWGMK